MLMALTGTPAPGPAGTTTTATFAEAVRRWHPAPPPARDDGIGGVLRRRRRRALALFAALISWLPAAQAEVTPGEAAAGSLLLRMQQGYKVATRLNTDVDIAVSGMVARVAVRQRFRNDGARWTEGVYVFPLPADAAVDRLRLVAGERIIEGEIREKAQAKKEYEQAKKAGKRASLVGQQRANLFTTSIANIAPGETVTVEIGYLQSVAYENDAFSLRFPMTLTPRYVPGTSLPDRQGSGWSPDTDRVPDASLITPPMVATSDQHRVTLEARIDAGVALENIRSRYHPIRVSGSNDVYTATLRDPGTQSDHDFELSWRPSPAAAPRALAFREDTAGATHLLLMLIPPTVPAPDTEMPRSITFVIDTSGSMHGVSIEQAKRSLGLALADLRPGDTFNVIQFNSVTDALFPAPVPATPGNVGLATGWVGRLQANGGTEMRPALMRALREPAREGLRQIVFVTDGAVGNEEELYRLIETGLGDARLFTVGIGSAPNGWFMRKAAEAGRGTFTTISALHEVQEKMGALLTRLRAPMLTDVELAWPADGVKAYPARVRDLYAGEPVLLKAKLDLAPRDGDRLVVRGNAPGGPWQASVALAGRERSAGVAALWARARIGALEDAGRRGADADETREQIVDTALGYGLVSRHTSLVAVDRTPVRPAGEDLEREQVPNLMPYGQSGQAIFGFPATATAGPALRFTGGLLMIAAVLLMLFRVCNLPGGRRAPARA